MGRTLTELYNDHSHFMITGHRGASFEFPENTLLAMEKAIGAGCDMIEFDLSVEIVEDDDITPFDKYIGYTEYDNGDYLRVYYDGEKLIGYFEESEE